MEEYVSQCKQDKFVDFLFNKKQHKVFLDIGAHDGISFSNTYFFEKYRNWTGICIEPNPDVFIKLQKNRSCILENCCISDEDKTVTFRKVEGDPEREMLSGILDFFDQGHINMIDTEIKLYGGKYTDIPIDSKNINEILLKHHIPHIDYCSIDTEGAEYLIIKSIDFNVIDITIFTIENNNNNNNKKVREFLKEKDYYCIPGGQHDDFFIKKGTLPILPFFFITKLYGFSSFITMIFKIMMRKMALLMKKRALREN